MIDWLTSKVGVLIAVLVLTSFALGLFAWEHSMLVDREFRSVADSISGNVDGLAGLSATLSYELSFGPEPDQLPLTVNGKAYSINITRDMVILSQGNRMVTSHFTGRVIPQNLTTRTLNITEFGSLEQFAHTGEREAGNELIIERAEVSVSGETKYITLVYWG